MIPFATKFIARVDLGSLAPYFLVVPIPRRGRAILITKGALLDRLSDEELSFGLAYSVIRTAGASLWLEAAFFTVLFGWPLLLLNRMVSTSQLPLQAAVYVTALAILRMLLHRNQSRTEKAAVLSAARLTGFEAGRCFGESVMHTVLSPGCRRYTRQMLNVLASEQTSDREQSEVERP